MKFTIGEWYKHTRFKNMIVKIIDRKTPHTFMVEFYTIANGKPSYICKSLCYFHKGDSEWEAYDEV